MSICGSARCGRTEDEFQALVQELLPPGKPYSLENPDRCFTKFWLAVAAIFKELEDCLCCLYANAIPCSPGYDPACDAPAPLPTCQPVGYVAPRTLLERHALALNFPLDCVDLTHERLCKWVEGGDCPIGSIEWLRWLMDFIGLDVTLDFDPGGIPIACHEIGKDPLCPYGPRITITGCDLEPVPVPPLGEIQVKDMLACDEAMICPKIEALRLKYFPAGVEIVYA